MYTPRPLWRLVLLVWVVGTCFACSENNPSRQASESDTGTDQGLSSDGGTTPDAQVRDAGAADSSTRDAHASDGSPIDASAADGAQPADAALPHDAEGLADALAPDALAPDALAPDADLVDAALPDMGGCGVCPPHAPICSGEEVCIAAPTVIISELMAQPGGELLDEDGRASDWIELQNWGDAVIDLEGWTLSDDPEQPAKWTFPATPLHPGTPLIVFASDKDRAEPDQALHTNFKLSAGGEFLGIFTAEGFLVDSFAPFPAQHEGVSYGTSQARERTQLIPWGADARWRVTAHDGAWPGAAFDDSQWALGATPIGFDIEIPVPPDPAQAPNIALGRPAVQSSQLAGFAPSLAVDGDVDTFTHTHSADEAATWRVTLDEATPIGLITVHNRTGCCGTRLRDLTVRVLDDAGNATFESALLNPENVLGAPAQLTVDLFEHGGPRLGREVEISRQPDLDLSGTNGGGNGDEATVLSLGEVRIYAANSAAALLGTTAPDGPGVQARYAFTVEDPALLEALTVDVDTDAGFVIWLNGVRVADHQAPEDLADGWALREAPDGIERISIDLSGALDQLQAGHNVLAVQALNSAADDPDLFLNLQLTGLSAPDGSQVFFREPTPGALNETDGFLGFTAAPTFSHAGGFAEGPFELTLHTETEGAAIYFTRDGTDPTPETGELYVGALPINSGGAFKARAYGPRHEPSTVAVVSFVFLDQIIAQTVDDTLALGLPAMWGDVTPDYGMDPRVTGALGQDDFGGRYADAMVDSLTAVPSLSLVVDPEHLFGANGIYTRSTSRGEEWIRPASVELFIPGEGPAFQVHCGLKIQGGAFRNHNLTRKHSLRLLFKSEYGPPRLNYPLLGPEATDRFDTITLRSNSNDGWQWGAAGSKPLYIRDSFGRRTMLDMGQVASHETFMHLYINGVYWGLYNPTERPDAAFAEFYIGGDEADWDAINSGDPVDGTIEAWQTLLQRLGADPQDPEALLWLEGRTHTGARNAAEPAWLNVDQYIDYMLTNLYGGNSDWPHKNYWHGRPRTGEFGFHFYMWDSEWSLGLRSNLNTNRINVDRGVAAAWALLRQNAEFRMRVADRAHRALFNGGALFVDPQAPEWDPEHPERNRPAARFAALAQRVERALVAESARWGDQHADTPYTVDEHWAVERDMLLSDYFPLRSAVFLEQLRAADLYPAVAAPEAAYSADSRELILTAPAGQIVYSLDGSDPRRFGGARHPDALDSESGAVIAVPEAAVLKARVWSEGAWSAVLELPLDAAL